MVSDKDPARERLLAAAVRAIDAGGTAAIRVIPVCREAGVSQGMVRYYFGDRQGLVDAAVARRFGDRFGELLTVFAETAKTCNTPDEFRALIKQALDGLFVPSRTKLRLERNGDVGAAVARPNLAAQIAAERDETLELFCTVLADAQARGLMKADLDPKLVAAFHLSMVHGYSLFELGGEALDMPAFNAIYQRALFGLIFD